MTNNLENSNIEEIIIKSFIGDASNFELNKLNDWRQQSKRNEQTYLHLKQMWDGDSQVSKYINYKSLKRRIIKKGFGKDQPNIKPKVFILNSFKKIAAVLALTLIASITVYQIISSDEEQARTSKVSAIETVTKFNSTGQKSRIILPDNSIVWLNSQSKLTYQKGFSDSIRYLKLVGEAYFEVKKDSNRPFIVQSGNIRTIALGTSFNIRDYQDEEYIQVSLLTGKVKVETINSNDEVYLLDPMNKIEFTKNAELINKSAFDHDYMSIWKEGIIHFQKESFGSVIRTLKRSYDVTFDTSNYTKKNWSYTGEFDDLSLELILKRLGYAEGFDYEITKKVIIITDKE